MAIPVGWKLHEQDAGWIYEIANPTNMTPSGPYTEAPAEAPAYGTLDVDAATKEQKLYARFSNSLYIDFPDFDAAGWSILKLRLLPPWSAENRTGYVQLVRHRVHAEFYPQDVRGNRQIMYETCLNMQVDGGAHGPGECPFDENKRDAVKAGLSKDAAAYLNNFNGRVTTIWQAIDMTSQESLAKHFVQRKNGAGQVMLDASGQPLWDVIPARFRMGNELLGDVRATIRLSGDPTHPDFGYTIAMLKQKTGPDQLDITYKAQVAGAKEALMPQLRPVLSNLIDLAKEEIAFSDRAMLRQVADKVRAKVGLPLKWAHETASTAPAGDAGEWVVHEQDARYEYHRTTRAVRLRGAV
ncbi:MAG: hypothetical protein M3Q55_11840 [Acidobacteriota bacterium]|nr:hypothetical protein [Acidobacteriota bacterium]